MSSRYLRTINKAFVFVAFAIALSFSSTSVSCAEQDDFHEQETLAPSEAATPPAAAPAALPREEDILVQAPSAKEDQLDVMRSYIVQTGGSLPIYDEDFRDFLDYGATVTLGMKKKIMPHLYLTPTLSLTLLNGEWDMNRHREIITVAEQEYNTTYGDISPEDVNPINTGDGYMSGGEAVVTNTEFLRHIDLDTSMYLIPISLNLTYQLHEDGVKKINPYFGGGVGFCVAKRDVESRTLKEKRYIGPNYFLDFNDNQTVTGQTFQLFAGIEIPLKKNIRIFAETSTVLYDLRGFDPILSISHREPIPEYYEARIWIPSPRKTRSTLAYSGKSSSPPSQ